jgi:hypothetical protein
MRWTTPAAPIPEEDGTPPYSIASLFPIAPSSHELTSVRGPGDTRQITIIDGRRVCRKGKAEVGGLVDVDRMAIDIADRRALTGRVYCDPVGLRAASRLDFPDQPEAGVVSPQIAVKGGCEEPSVGRKRRAVTVATIVAVGRDLAHTLGVDHPQTFA